MAKGRPKPEERILDVLASLDVALHYHIDMILSYEKRNPIDELHASHQGDPVFELFGLTDLAFTKKRWIAGFANSCATNLGRFTDKATKIILAGAFNVTPLTLLKKVTITANNRTETEETDGVLLVDEVDAKAVARLRTITNRLKKQLADPLDAKGLGFEFRGRYGKNDDTLIQKDEHMAHAIRDLGAVPVLAIFSTNNAKGAIARLRNSWVVMAGMETINLLGELTEINLVEYLKSRETMLAGVPHEKWTGS
jgi:hypothetical protein